MEKESVPIYIESGSTKKHEHQDSVFSYNFTKPVLAIILALALACMLVLLVPFGFRVSIENQPSESVSTSIPGGVHNTGGVHNIGGVHTTGDDKDTGDDTELCVTASCVEAAAFILQNIDPDIDPCTDFYNFTCGKWAMKNVVPAGSGSTGTFDSLANQNLIGLRKVLDANDDMGIEAVRKLMDFYQSCMDVEKINTLGADPVMAVIKDTGGWGLLNGSSSSKWNINSDEFMKDKALGSPAFFTVDIAIDDKNSSQYILEVSQSGLTLPSSGSYLDQRTAADNIKAFKQLFVTVMSLLNPNGSTTLYSSAADDVIDLETSLAKIFVSDVELRNIDKTYNKMNLSNISTLYSDFNWTGHVGSFFAMVNINVDGSEPVLVRTPTYLEKLKDTLSQYQPGVLENYAKWQLVLQFLPYLSEDFTSAYSAFTLATLGSGEEERYVGCISLVQDVMSIALSVPYTNSILAPYTKPNVSEMIDAVKNAFKERLDGNSWIDDATREASKDKVDAITKMVAYPDGISNKTYLNELYAEYTINADNYFGNYLQTVKLSFLDDLRSLRQAVDKSVWLTPPTAVNAYYDPQFNEFVFLEGILNVPFFDAGWPEYLKFGALGVVIGHELTHGFDDQGQRYDKDGILRPWWSNASVTAFKEKQDCFVQQYSGYEMFGYQINGSLTLGENIADNGGIKAAFQAYRDAVKNDTSPPPSLPALSKYTSDQLFFMAFGQLWCSLFSPEFIAADTKTNPHSPGPYRVIGSLVNSPEFADAFQCKEGSPMNPKDKCLMW